MKSSKPNMICNSNSFNGPEGIGQTLLWLIFTFHQAKIFSDISFSDYPVASDHKTPAAIHHCSPPSPLPEKHFPHSPYPNLHKNLFSILHQTQYGITTSDDTEYLLKSHAIFVVNSFTLSSFIPRQYHTRENPSSSCSIPLRK